MSQHTPPSRQSQGFRPSPNVKDQRLPRGRAKLVAYEEAMRLVRAVRQIRAPRGFGFAHDHLVRAAGNTALRLSEASGRGRAELASEFGGLGNRYQHLEAAYAENQEAQTALQIIRDVGGEVSDSLFHQADRVGGLIYGLVQAEARGRGE